MVPKEEAKPSVVETKDKWTIITLRVRGHVPLSIEKSTIGGNRVLVYTFGEEATGDFDAYMRGEPMPVADIREVEQAEREFKNNLHRFA